MATMQVEEVRLGLSMTSQKPPSGTLPSSLPSSSRSFGLLMMAMVQKRPMKAAKRSKRRTASSSLAKRFANQEPRLDTVRFSAHWRPFGLDLRQKHR